MIWRPKRREMPDGRVVWVARYKDARGRERIAKPAWNGRSGTFKLRKDAQRAIDEAFEQLTPERASSVEGYLDRWLTTHPRSQRTDDTNAGRIRNVLGVELEGLELRDWDMRELRRRHAQELVAQMLTQQQRSPGGSRNILRALSVMFEDAITDELAELNPWTGVKVRDDDRRATKHARELHVWSFDEMHTFASHAGTHEPMIRTLADCGLRVGELFALKRADLTDGLLSVRGTAWEGQVIESSATKNHSREIPVPPGCLALLAAMPPRIDTPWLFPTASGKLWRYNNWRRMVWAPACEAAGIEPTPHELRHSWVTNLRAAGVDPADLADVAGHSVQTATTRYTHPLRRSHGQIQSLVG